MIIPLMKGQRLSYWNTNEWARALSKTPTQRRSEFLDPTVKERLSENAKRRLSADFLYGGYLEDRSFVWRDSYMEPSKFLHLGLDIVAPAGAAVRIDQYAELVQVYQDPPGETEGWGTRLMFRLLDYPNIHLVYGHLRPSLYHDVGTVFTPDDVIGFLGTPEQNGGWSSHLHVQAIHGDVTPFLEDPASLDGYGELAGFEAMAEKFPDPMRFIRLA